MVLGYQVKWNATGVGAIGVRFDKKEDAELFAKIHDYVDSPEEYNAETEEQILDWYENGTHAIYENGKFIDKVSGSEL